MPWARDAVAGSRALIESARSLLTATTRVMAAGMVADRIAVRGFRISSDAIAGIEISTISVADVGIAIVISTVIGTGGAGGRHS